MGSFYPALMPGVWTYHSPEHKNTGMQRLPQNNMLKMLGYSMQWIWMPEAKHHSNWKAIMHLSHAPVRRDWRHRPLVDSRVLICTVYTNFMTNKNSRNDMRTVRLWKLNRIIEPNVMKSTSSPVIKAGTGTPHSSCEWATALASWSLTRK